MPLPYYCIYLTNVKNTKAVSAPRHESTLKAMNNPVTSYKKTTYSLLIIVKFRTAAVTNLISNIRSHIKSINPQMELQLWASAHWKSRYSCGQNWASKKYVPTANGIYTSSYNQTGFADQLEAFVLGAYADNVWISEDPMTDWSVENFVNTYNNYTMGDCKVYGSIPAYPPYDNASKLSDAVYLCMKRTDGLMVFELSHVLTNGTWDAIKEGINRVEK